DNFVSAKENPQANDENPSALALGGMSKGLTPLEMTAAYGAIANDGVYIAPTPIIKILDKDGDLLIENTPKETVVVSPQVAYIMKDILHTTVTNGLAKQAQISNMAVAGKTGTTQNQADIWFVGFTPYYVSSVWIGNDSPAITLNRSSGTAALLWKQINQGAHKNLEAKTSFPRPEGIVSVTVCSQSGLLPSENCSHDPRGTIKTEIFAKGTEPTSTCDVHVAVDIDETTGKVANAFCPQDRVVTRVFIQRKKSFDPSLGLTPSDIGYQVPGACTEHSQDSPGYTEEPDDNENPEVDPDNPNSENPNNGNGSTENEKPTKPENGNGNGNNGNGNNGSNNKDDDFETIPIDPNA
ncbi:MAG TPA: penicillin-binding transpeptidase domain-containing protein, partial [Tissierellaceae bacterium]